MSSLSSQLQKTVEPQYIRAPKGLQNVIVDQTRISGVDPKGETTIYRGYLIEDLARALTFEEAAFLFLYGHLPSEEEVRKFSQKLNRERVVPEEVYEIFEKMPRTTHPMAILRTGISFLGTLDEKADDLSRENLYETAIKLIAKTATIAANGYRITRGMEPVKPDPSLPHALDSLRMIIGREPSKLEARAFESSLILYMDHGFNASTFTVRVIASTLSDMYSAVTGGVGALKGPLHGGANEKAMYMLLEIGSKEKARQYILDKLARKEKIMGFGHRVYKVKDPRVDVAKEYLRKMAKTNPEAQKYLELCEEIEKIMWEQKKLPANIDFYTAPLYYLMGIPIEMYTPIFAMARVVGWTSHYIEQLENNKIIRPKEEYVGPVGLKLPPEKQPKEDP